MHTRTYRYRFDELNLIKVIYLKIEYFTHTNLLQKSKIERPRHVLHSRRYIRYRYIVICKIKFRVLAKQ